MGDPLLLSTLTWTERLLGVALFLQTVELIQVREAFGDAGVFRWQILREDQADLPAPVRWPFALLLPYPAFTGLLALRLLLSPLLLLGMAWAALPLLVSQLAINARFRGTFNGGSDYMSVVVLLALAVASLVPSPFVTRACLAYVCAQLVFSYFIAGAAKLGHSEWRRGSALAKLLAANSFSAQTRLTRLAAKPALARLGTWGVLTFECLFPLALLGPRVAVPLLTLGVLFHLANALVLGLNRFLFAWLAAYPALLYFSVALAQSN